DRDERIVRRRKSASRGREQNVACPLASLGQLEMRFLQRTRAAVAVNLEHEAAARYVALRRDMNVYRHALADEVVIARGRRRETGVLRGGRARERQNQDRIAFPHRVSILEAR